MYNTMLDVAFTVEHTLEDPCNLCTQGHIHLVLAALQRRVDYLKANPSEAAEAFGICDTIETETSNDTV